MRPNPPPFSVEHFSLAVQFLWSLQETKQGGACFLHTLSRLYSKGRNAALNHFPSVQRKSCKWLVIPSQAGASVTAEWLRWGLNKPLHLLFSHFLALVHVTIIIKAAGVITAMLICSPGSGHMPVSCPLRGAEEQDKLSGLYQDAWSHFLVNSKNFHS